MTETDFRALRVEKRGEEFSSGVQTLSRDALPLGDLTVRVGYSSLNYKDALSATGGPGVTKTYPHTPGIDAAGTVLDSRDERFRAATR
jgi:NADPH:quinone reductase-like Zn-dependent oxidoreductase